MRARPPSGLSFCTCDTPTVLMSHWDADHWAAATLDSKLLQLTWVVPRQSISHTHTAFGNNILRAGGRILVVGTAPPPICRSTSGQILHLRRCTGADRNGSGLALIVEDTASNRGWLLTGDAAYNQIPGPLPVDLAAVIVPHHGAAMGTASIPPPPSGHQYSRLLYSFGPDNKHGRGTPPIQHPTQSAVSVHTAAGWTHNGWITPPGFATANAPVLATATHKISHESGIAVGWTSTPPVNPLSGHVGSCSDVMPVTQV